MYLLRYLLSLLLLLTGLLASGQRHDYSWLVGYELEYDPQDDYNGGTWITYHDGFEMTPIDSPIFVIHEFNINISDSSGQFLFFSNGIYIWNKYIDTMKGASSFNEGEWRDVYEDTALPYMQGGIALPYPDKADHYIIIHTKLDIDFEPEFTVYGDGLYSTIVDMTGDGGLGEVTEVNQVLSTESFDRYGVTATRHANGRDWWVIMPETHSNRYWTFLIDPSGPHVHRIQEVGDPLQIGNRIGQAVFSPDGQWYVRNAVSHYQDYDEYLNIYRFDRSTGTLYDPQQFVYDDDGPGAGVAISPNSRYLYANQGTKLYQFDLLSDDIHASQLLIDEYNGFKALGVFPTRFLYMQLAPNGKIYMTCIGGFKEMHTIHQPNKRGKACDFRQHDLILPRANGISVPNHPNFRLGPIDGSPADTLGIDNLPYARWRYDLDCEVMTVEFTDGSWYEPAEWYWDFGDGHTSTDTSPVHTYSDTGRYEVCMVVSNVNSSDTMCREVYVEDCYSATHAPRHPALSLTIYPNPVIDGFIIRSPEHLGDVEVHLRDMTGRLAWTQSTTIPAERSVRFGTSASSVQRSAHRPLSGDLSAGVYALEVVKDGVVVAVEKVVVVASIY